MIAYYSGEAAAAAVQRYGFYAAVAVAVAVAGGWMLVSRARRRAEERL